MVLSKQEFLGLTSMTTHTGKGRLNFLPLHYFSHPSSFPTSVCKWGKIKKPYMQSEQWVYAQWEQEPEVSAAGKWEYRGEA